LGCVFACARFVPEPGQNIHLPLPKKKPSGRRNGWAFLSMFGSVAPTLLDGKRRACS
jgi:hypothetical protein